MILNTNAQALTEQRLENLVIVTKRTLDILFEQVDEGVLKSIKSPEALQQFHKDIDSVILSKVKDKFNLK